MDHKGLDMNEVTWQAHTQWYISKALFQQALFWGFISNENWLMGKDPDAG